MVEADGGNKLRESDIEVRADLGVKESLVLSGVGNSQEVGKESSWTKLIDGQSTAPVKV